MLRSRIAKFAALVAVVAATLVPSAGAQAGPADPPSGWPCTSTPTLLTKVDGYVVAKMRLKCTRNWALMRVSPDIERTGGGQPARSFTGQQEGWVETCYNTDVCVASFRFKDVAGTNQYILFNEPGGQGTVAGNSATSGYRCNTDEQNLWCGRTTAYL